VAVGELNDRRVTYTFDVSERATDRLICEASYRVACVDAASFAARQFPREIATVLAPAVTSEA